MKMLTFIAGRRMELSKKKFKAAKNVMIARECKRRRKMREKNAFVELKLP